ncbi:MAG: GWxTD domain-containing protein [Saprospiraceae bacterium]
MKTIILILLFISLSTRPISALDLDVNIFSFYADKSYVEVHIRVDAKSVHYVEEGNKKTSSIEFILLANDGQKVAVYGDKFILNGIYSETNRDFIVVKRFYIEPGFYHLYVQAIDNNNIENKLELERQFDVMSNWDGQYGLSDPILMADKISAEEGSNDPMSRHGFLVEPLPYGYADTMHHTVYLLQEIYLPNVDSTEMYFLNFTISDQYKEVLTSKILLSQYKKLENKPFQFVLLPVSLKELPSGQYHLTTNLQTKDKKKLASRKINFFKSNPVADLSILYQQDMQGISFAAGIDDGELDYILKAHIPITDNIQLPTLQALIQGAQNQKKRKFIHQYWTKRSPSHPAEAFEKYLEVARAVDKEYYSNVGYGFQTHRGHIFLKHGKPSSVLSIDNETDAPPYEIWFYNKIMTTNQTNVRFLFWNESLAHNDFWLLHSTCYGERNNPGWESQLYKSIPEEDKTGNSIDGREIKRGLNRQAKIYFNQF